jgi:lipoate-protein ligase A
MGVPTNLSPHTQKEIPGQCFIGAEQFDLLYQGRKIAGAAQRRNRLGLLIQGSIQPPPGVNRMNWLRSFQKTATAWWKVQWLDWLLTPHIAERTQELAAQKYSQAVYNRRK